jgi:hypothetical protein
MFIRLLIPGIVLFLIEIYAFQAIKTLLKARWKTTSYQIISLLILIFLVYSFSKFDRSVGQTKQTMLTMAFFFIFYVPKLKTKSSNKNCKIFFIAIYLKTETNLINIS